MRKSNGAKFQGPVGAFAEAEISGRDKRNDRAEDVSPDEAVPANQGPALNLRADRTEPGRSAPLSALTPPWPRVFPGL